MALPTLASGRTCPRSVPLRVRLNRWINRQAAHPRGPFGLLLGAIWRRDHRALNRATLDLLGLEPEHDVLEIGFGPGDAVSEAARRARHVTGLDVSQTMLAIAARRNRRATARGRVCLRLVENARLGLGRGSIDRAFSVHSIYFWPEPERTIAEVAGALRPGGRLVIAMRPESSSLPSRFRDPSYRFYAPEQVEHMMLQAGFDDVRTLQRTDIAGDLVWVIGQRKG